jgi:ABC-type antimicrobial peptide transport system permease subunit
MAVSKITWTPPFSRKARLVLTVLAIGLSVSLVIAVTSGYASAEAAVIRYFTEFMGSTDMKITREPGQPGNIKESLVVDALNRDRDVKLAVGRFETDTNSSISTASRSSATSFHRHADRREAAAGCGFLRC